MSDTGRLDAGARVGATGGAHPSFSEREAVRLWRAAEELEGLFVTQLLQASGITSGESFAHVPGSGVFQGLAQEALGRALAEQADFGLAETLYNEMSGGAPPAVQARSLVSHREGAGTSAHDLPDQDAGIDSSAHPLRGGGDLASIARDTIGGAAGPAPSPSSMPREAETTLEQAESLKTSNPEVSPGGGWREPETLPGAQRATQTFRQEEVVIPPRASTGRGGEDPPRAEPEGERQDPPRAQSTDRLAPFATAIREAAERFGVDRDLIRAVILQESGGDPRAVSPKGAQGLMQILEATGRSLGLGRPFDPRENILAGTRYLSDLIERHGGDIALGLAAYNAGPGAVARHGGIPPFRETLRYVSGVLGLRETLRSERGEADAR